MATVIYAISLAWLLVIGIATTKCVDISLVTIEGVFALFITVAICVLLYEKEKRKT